MLSKSLLQKGKLLSMSASAGFATHVKVRSHNLKLKFGDRSLSLVLELEATQSHLSLQRLASLDLKIS